MRRLKALWDLTRFDHELMLGLAVIIGAVIAEQGIPPASIELSLALLTAVFIGGSAFALNDYFDREIDRKNNRVDRPLVRGDMVPKTALAVSVIMFASGIIASYFVNLGCFVIAVFTGIFAILYDWKLKNIKPIGNIYIAYTMAVPFLFGGVVILPTVPLIIWVLASIAFLAGIGREIMKDVQDKEGDLKEDLRSLPMYIGDRNSLLISSLFFMMAVVLSVLPLVSDIAPTYRWDRLYAGTVLIADIVFVTVSFLLLLKEKPSLKSFRKITLFGLFLGLIAFLAGALG